MKQIPEPGSSIVLHKGDIIEFTLQLSVCESRSGMAWVRSTIGNAETHRQEIIDNAEHGRPILNSDWHDIPMRKTDDRRYVVSIPLLDVGRFEAKTFFKPDQCSEPVWPAGRNVSVKVEPSEYCCNNAIYTAFVRQFGPDRSRKPLSEEQAESIRVLDDAGYAVIPASGTFRNLIEELDFIVNKLRFRIIQLLPIHPTPTTYARMGRFGSPYAALDFKDVDPALTDFDRMTTPMDQFQELADAIHARKARLFLDIPVNHTGWASKLQIEHPEWFDRDKDMRFISPGAWGVTWADLARLDYEKQGLWLYMAEVFLFWARRGVDGFRCDAGYMVPCRAWKYIVAKVRSEYPDTIFLLEGLGGKPEIVKDLLFIANLNWAYSELFQNYDRTQVETCLRESIRTTSTKGLFVHYAETHDNNRLAADSQCYSRLRVSLSALCSIKGAFGITNGVEWFATEKIDVHGAPSLNWGDSENQVEHISRLNAILEAHPAFHSGAQLRLVQQGDANSIALLRYQPEGEYALLVLVNLDARSAWACWKPDDFALNDKTLYDLVTGKKIDVEQRDGMLACKLGVGQALCLSSIASDLKMVEKVLRRPMVLSECGDGLRARAKALEVYAFFENNELLSQNDIELKVKEMLDAPAVFCAHASKKKANGIVKSKDGLSCTRAPVISWRWPEDLQRLVMIPPGHLLCVNSEHPFAIELLDGEHVLRCDKSIRRSKNSHFVLILPMDEPSSHRKLTLDSTVFESAVCRHARASVIYLSVWQNAWVQKSFSYEDVLERDSYALCVNGRGGMAQVRGAWGEIRSQYDAILAGNVDQDCPVDRRVMFTRCRAWMVYEGYSQAIDKDCLDVFSVAEDGSASWRFVVSAAHGKKVPIEFSLSMRAGTDTVCIKILRHQAPLDCGYVENDKQIKIILRPDIEDRVNHEKTKAYKGLEPVWRCAVEESENGFVFSPSKERRLHMSISRGVFVSEPEWIYSISHSEDAKRGLDYCSDLFSPGYFSFTLKAGENAFLKTDILTPSHRKRPKTQCDSLCPASRPGESLRLNAAMSDAIRSFIVKRGMLKTVIAGYPWFLDWGRDTLICLRGIMAAGMLEEARSVLRQFGRFELRGTLPNALSGNDDANRDTSDAPLWFCVACAELVRNYRGVDFLEVDCGGRTIRQVLRSIIEHYIIGTPNGVKMDGRTGLVFSPAHFTWMDTNYPAGTPREGYPIEIQALWYAALDFAAELEPDAEWSSLADLVRESIKRYFVRSAVFSDLKQNSHRAECEGWLSDCLHAERAVGAENAAPDDALRPNQLLAITLGALSDRKIQHSILAACEELLTPGAIRSLANRPVTCSLPIMHHGNLLNNPLHPYLGRYEGDEDTCRKPAYHNGTAWTWLFPSYCEALYMTYGYPVRDTALSILSSSTMLINRGCIGHVPEITDGDSPHLLRGCGAQAWGATELYRVLAELSSGR